MRKRDLMAGLILLAIGSVYLLNASWLSSSHPENRQILAHRGLHQTFNPQGVENDTCTASRMETPRHNYIENTLLSLQGAIDMGADILEFDIHPTTDGEFMVFHDWTLSCRTNGKGRTRKQSSTYLKTLDIGYGYTADGGNTFPFRGKFIGAMPTLRDVLVAFPDTYFFINMKSNKTSEAELLTSYLQTIPLIDRSLLTLYGNGKAVEDISYFKSRYQDFHKIRY